MNLLSRLPLLNMTKLKAQSPKLKRSSTLQIPKASLAPGALELGAWNLELLLSFEFYPLSFRTTPRASRL